MTADRRYPFSDLTTGQVEKLVQDARREQSQAIRRFFASLFNGDRKASIWPRRHRETQVWPPKHTPALSLMAHRC